MLLAVVVLSFIARVELQHAAAVFVHGELGALQAAALTRSQLGRVKLITIGLIGKKMRRVHDAGIDVAVRCLGGKTLGNRIERRQALEYATMSMRGQQLGIKNTVMAPAATMTDAISCDSAPALTATLVTATMIGRAVVQ